MTQDVLLAVFTGAEATHAYSAFLPSVFTIETFARSAEGVAAIRRGETLATAVTLGLGWTVARLADSPWPLVAAVITAALMVSVYEAAVARAQEGVA